MSIEAMSKAYESLNKSRPFDADNARMQRDAMDALRAAIQQAEAKTDEPVACPTCGSDAPYTGSCGTSDSDTKALCKRQAHPSPGVPDGYVLVPLQVLHDASDALGNFIMDHGWGDSDMQAMDNLDAHIARHTSAQAQKGQP